MRAYVVRRVIQLIFLFFALIIILFLIFRLLPGNPAAMVLGPAMNPESVAAQIRLFGMDQPLYMQFYLYMKNLLTGHLGISFQYQKDVLDILADKFLNTIVLMGTAFFMTFVVGVVGGAYVAWGRHHKLGEVLISVVLFIRSSPIFFTGMVLLTIFSYRLGWLPIGRMHTPGFYVENLFLSYFSIDFLEHLILPALTMMLYYLGNPFFVMRNSMLEIKGEDFIDIAKAKGINYRQLLFKHGVRNGLLPVVTMLSIMFAYTLGGQVVLETVFSWPGMGRELVIAVHNHDYPVAQGAFFLIGSMVITGNFLVDLLYAYLDPRIVYT
jgi:peptide/nickel transport system permease protein